MARARTQAPASSAEWDVNDAPPSAVKKVRNAGRQFGPTKAVAPTTKAAPRTRAPKKPETKVSIAAKKRAAAGVAAEKQTRESVQGRTNWERTKGGKARMRDVVDYATDQHNKMVAERPELGMTPLKRSAIKPRQAYEAYGFGEHHMGASMMDEQLPGMEDPHALPRPKRWEEHTEAERADISKRVAKKSGATPQSMERSFGAQLDQGYIRAHQAGHSEPYSQTFYTHGEPAQQLRATSRRQNVPLGLVAATNADTSPNMKFSFTSKEGHTSYPNAEQAEHAISEVRKGKAPGKITKKGLSGLALSGFDTNFKKAVSRAHQVIRKGKSVSETFTGTGAGSGFGPKTAAYHNSWLTSSPQSFVSDVHSGGGGMLPHLSSDKPLLLDEKGGVRKRSSGKDARDKSEREKAIETTGFHAMADYAARNAMKKRGLGSIPQAQATQWGEERIRRHEQAKDPRVAAGFPSGEKTYPPIAHPAQFAHHEGQGRLF